MTKNHETAHQRLVTEVQHALNDFFGRRLRGYSPIRVDGIEGQSTNKRIMAAKFFLGYGPKRAADFSEHLIRQLHNPMDRRHFKLASDGDYKLGFDRRADYNKAYEFHQHPAAPATGLVWMDGHWVASWIADILGDCRNHGWPGWVLSGWRDPNYSQHLCYVMCGAPACPGTCAGLSSRHVGRIEPDGAADCSYYAELDQVLQSRGHWDKLKNILPRDRPHHSREGN